MTTILAMIVTVAVALRAFPILVSRSSRRQMEQTLELIVLGLAVLYVLGWLK